MGNFKITVGMSTAEIMKNINNLSNVTKTTRQNIINFCKSDTDGIVTNTIEFTMLNAWGNGKEKIPMPQKPVETGYKFFDNKYVNAQNNTEYIKSVCIYGGLDPSKNADTFTYQNKDGYSDILMDRDGDGYADYRQVDDSHSNNPWVQRFDTNLDGKFDEYNKVYDE